MLSTSLVAGNVWGGSAGVVFKTIEIEYGARDSVVFTSDFLL